MVYALGIPRTSEHERGPAMKIGDYETGRVYNIDCLEGMKAIPDGAV